MFHQSMTRDGEFWWIPCFKLFQQVQSPIVLVNLLHPKSHISHFTLGEDYNLLERPKTNGNRSHQILIILQLAGHVMICFTCFIEGSRPRVLRYRTINIAKSLSNALNFKREFKAIACKCRKKYTITYK